MDDLIYLDHNKCEYASKITWILSGIRYIIYYICLYYFYEITNGTRCGWNRLKGVERCTDIN